MYKTNQLNKGCCLKELQTMFVKYQLYRGFWLQFPKYVSRNSGVQRPLVAMVANFVSGKSDVRRVLVEMVAKYVSRKSAVQSVLVVMVAKYVCGKSSV